MTYPQPGSQQPLTTTRSFGFRNSIWYLQIAVPAVMLTMAIIGVLVSLLRNGDSFSERWGFQYVYLVLALAVFVYFGFFRGYKVEVSEGIITWNAPYRKRSASMADVTGSKFAWWDIAHRQPTLLLRNQRPMLMEARGYGWPQFVVRFNQERGVVVLNDPRIGDALFRRHSNALSGGFFER